MPTPAFPAITHVAITVADLEVSEPWYRRLIGAEPVLSEDTGSFVHVVWAIGDTLLGIHHFPDGSDHTFDERQVGLDHVAFGCASRAELESWAARLDELEIPHGGIEDAHYGSGLSFRDPDGVALEFFAPPL